MVMSENQQSINAQNAAMIRELQLDGRCDEHVLSVMETLDRFSFLPVDARVQPIEMRPISIGYGQTMSAPFIVGSMSSLLEVKPGQRILEIGTGCGYQTAVLLQLGAIVYSIEIIPELAQLASRNLKRLGFSNYHLRETDGYFGWLDASPFDRIIAAAAAPTIPNPWLSQLREGGLIVLPLERDGREWMVKARKINNQLVLDWLYGVRFVPFVGKIRDSDSPDE